MATLNKVPAPRVSIEGNHVLFSARCCTMKIQSFIQFFVTTGRRRKGDMRPLKLYIILEILPIKESKDRCSSVVSDARNTLRRRENKVTPPLLRSLPLHLLALYPMLPPCIYSAPISSHRPSTPSLLLRLLFSTCPSGRPNSQRFTQPPPATLRQGALCRTHIITSLSSTDSSLYTSPLSVSAAVFRYLEATSASMENRNGTVRVVLEIWLR